MSVLTIKAVMACSLAAATWVRSGAPESFPTAFAEVFFAHHTCLVAIRADSLAAFDPLARRAKHSRPRTADARAAALVVDDLVALDTRPEIERPREERSRAAAPMTNVHVETREVLLRDSLAPGEAHAVEQQRLGDGQDGHSLPRDGPRS
eukprot:13845-Pelagococcus_subviridis.AAC.5